MRLVHSFKSCRPGDSFHCGLFLYGRISPIPGLHRCDNYDLFTNSQMPPMGQTFPHWKLIWGNKVLFLFIG